MSNETKQGLDIQRIDQFVELLLGALYELGLEPMSLSERPSAFDKHPQELFAYLRVREREPDPVSRVRAAFEEWQTWLLRKVEASRSNVKERAFPRLATLYTFMLENADLFDRRTLAHLRKSIYGRTYAYLYPRLAQIQAFRQYCQQEGLLTEKITEKRYRHTDGEEQTEQQRELLRAVTDADFIREHFPQGTSGQWKQMVDIFGEEQASIMQEAAINFLLANRYWFNRVFMNK